MEYKLSPEILRSLDQTIHDTLTTGNTSQVWFTMSRGDEHKKVMLIIAPALLLDNHGFNLTKDDPKSSTDATKP